MIPAHASLPIAELVAKMRPEQHRLSSFADFLIDLDPEYEIPDYETCRDPVAYEAMRVRNAARRRKGMSA